MSQLHWSKNALLIGAALTTLLGTASAQTGGTKNVGVETVIVTAEKRAENVQDVPSTVTPFTGATLEKLHFQDLKDLNGSVPNFQIFENGGVALVSMITIRGIGESNNPMPYVGTEVSTIVDGSVQATNLFSLSDQFDLERIEMLSGPQGTLFGANTTAGVINVITRQPTGEYGAYGAVTLGNYARRDMWGAVNFPIAGDELIGKIAFSHRQRDGFYTNLYNGDSVGDQDSDIFRGYLKWTPNDNFDVQLQGQYQHMVLGNTYLNTMRLTYPGEIFYVPNGPKGFQVYDNIPYSDRDRLQAYTLTANWRSPIGKITAISNYQAYHYFQLLDLSGIKQKPDCSNCFDGFGGPNRGWQMSQEIRDDVQLSDDVQLLVGVFGQMWGDHPDGLTLLGFADPHIISKGVTTEHSADVSLFGQVNWNITDKLRLQFGMRGAWDYKQLYRANYIYFQPAGVNPLLGLKNLEGAINLGSTPGNEPSEGRHSWTDFGGKIGLDYHFNDDVMVYGFYARGFKSGGYNGAVTKRENIGPYNPEHVDTVEAGIKSTWLDNRLQVNASVFYNKWKQMQVNQFTFAGGALNSTILNAGEATTDGFELSATVVPVDGLSISGNLGYVNATYDFFHSSQEPLCPPPPAVQPPGCAIDFSGRDIPYAPHITGSVSGNYTTNIAGGEASANLQYTYSGPKWGNYTQVFNERLPPVGLLNGSVSWGPEDGKWTLELWGRNLTNKLYTAAALDVPPLFTEAVLGNPRETGITLKFNL